MRQFLTFVVVTGLWAIVARIILGLDIAHPVAVGAVWLVGFVWMTGYIADGTRSADLLTKRWLQMLAGMTVLAGAGFLVFS